MRHTLSVFLIAAGLTASSSIVAGAQPSMGSANLLPAPVGHSQPHAQGFAPRSDADRAEQDRLSAEDARQQKLDEMLDQKLNICRGC
jgi:hypothetical protein